MPKTITQYRVFIASPGGLDEERKKFRHVLEKCSLQHGIDKGVMFHPVGWEDTLGGAGRPQELINEDLKQCDYAVFVLHDRWGSPTGSGHTSGTEEEWALAEALYKEAKIRNIALFFKKVDAGKRADPGDQLKPVLAFRKRIEKEKRYLFKQYEQIEEFADALDGHLARWLKDHETKGGSFAKELAAEARTGGVAGKPAPQPAPGFDFWIGEAQALFDGAPPDLASAIYCAARALAAARTDIEWARAKHILGIAKVRLGRLDEALSAFEEIGHRLHQFPDVDHGVWWAKARISFGYVLGNLGRSEDEIAVYDDVLARFGAASESPLREAVAKALVNKGVSLGALGRNEDAITVYDDVLARFGAASESPLREQVAKALVGKGVSLGALGRSEDAIAVYDDVLARFGAASESPLREAVAQALVNKAVSLGALGRREDAIAIYDDVLARFGAASESPLREAVAKALVNKGASLGALGRREDAITVYDDVLARFGAASESPLREAVAKALVNKGNRLGALGRNEDAIAVYDDVLARFGAASEAPLREQVARVLVGKGVVLGELGRCDEAIAVYDDVLARFGSATEPPLRKIVEMASAAKKSLTRAAPAARKAKSRRS
jgi:tetratricopeptide (TPR) repeat protein